LDRPAQDSRTCRTCSSNNSRVAARASLKVARAHHRTQMRLHSHLRAEDQLHRTTITDLHSALDRPLCVV
jgi:hypothetical protein